jgi:hypothetical protein
VKLRLLLMLLALAGCRDQRPSTPTAEESDQLNEMDDALNGLAANNEEGPADRSTGPSNLSGGGPSRE